MKYLGRKPKVNYILVALVGLFFCQAAQADLVFSAPPRETPEEGLQRYGPLVESMSRILGERVVYKHPRDFLRYSNNMRKGEYDIVFDGPHFTAWRIEHLDHQPAARLKGALVFYVVSNNPELETLEDLIGRPVCGLASPNLATMTLLFQYKNPIQQPSIISTRGGFKNVFAAFEQGRCEAAVLRSTFYDNNVPNDQKQGVKIIFKSKPVPNQAITVGPNVNEEGRKKLAAALTSEEGAVGARKLFDRYSKDSKAFVATGGEEFTYLNLLLEGVVRGW